MTTASDGSGGELVLRAGQTVVPVRDPETRCRFCGGRDWRVRRRGLWNLETRDKGFSTKTPLVTFSVAFSEAKGLSVFYGDVCFFFFVSLVFFFFFSKSAFSCGQSGPKV